MSHGRHAYNNAKRRGEIEWGYPFFDHAAKRIFRREAVRWFGELENKSADEQEDEINDEWMGEDGLTA